MHHYPRTVAAIAAASLLATFAAQANKGADYKPHHKHETERKFTITGGATYLEPSFNGLDYVDVISTDTLGVDTVKAHNVDPEFNWGYFLGFGYMISKNYDVQATWAQYNSTSTNTTTPVGATGGVSGILTSNNEFISLGAGDSTTAHTNEAMDYQVFDANLGQYRRITENLKSRLFAGVRYAKITTDTDNTYTDALGTSVFDNYDSSFSGVGPEAGMDLEYKVYKGLGVVGSLAAAFLVGNQDTSSDVFSSVNGEQNTVKADESTRMVPALNAKLGANWSVPYQWGHAGFGIEAGYQVAYYFNVVDQVQYTPGTELTHNYSNVGMMGPYLNVSAMF